MAKVHFSLIEHPWLFLIIFIFTTLLCFALAGAVLQAAFGMLPYSAVSSTWRMLLGNLFLIFFVVPFILGFPTRKHPYKTYLSEIRLNHLKPFIKLIFLGVSCYVILALCQVAGVLVYRLMHHLPINMSFMRYSFVLANELPPRSMSWFYSLPSILEEVAFRGIILAMFLRFYNKPKAIVFSALGFGVIHLLNLLNGDEPTWVSGQIVWAAIMGMFYGYVTIKTDSLVPAMIVHYLGNLFISVLNGSIQMNATVAEQSVYGTIFTLGVVPVTLMILWVKRVTSTPKMIFPA